MYNIEYFPINLSELSGQDELSKEDEGIARGTKKKSKKILKHKRERKRKRKRKRKRNKSKRKKKEINQKEINQKEKRK